MNSLMNMSYSDSLCSGPLLAPKRSASLNNCMNLHCYVWRHLNKKGYELSETKADSLFSLMSKWTFLKPRWIISLIKDLISFKNSKYKWHENDENNAFHVALKGTERKCQMAIVFKADLEKGFGCICSKLVFLFFGVY